MARWPENFRPIMNADISTCIESDAYIYKVTTEVFKGLKFKALKRS